MMTLLATPIDNCRGIIGLLCTILLGASATSLCAQEIVLERQVVGSTGYDRQTGNTIFQYTVGEAAVATLMQPTFLFTQGFQQPQVTVSSHIPQLPDLTDFIVFPNPAISYTTIRFTLVVPGSVRFILVNNAGQIVYSEDRDAAAGQLEYRIPLEQYASGLYYLVVSVNSSKKYTQKLIIQ
ncbi:T9SS type A sorting domain-containing protein [Parapedobacter pyrenivorans]|uniref:T9SS type A sorting domain-containing protein n=1 Tax=Parapedobacter pyrenivorans TaxID=1305674 RepID=UPI001662C23E|nr:T9SS type A sorting domain-containing protein [Parapedobacter pyrenivorans]